MTRIPAAHTVLRIVTTLAVLTGGSVGLAQPAHAGVAQSTVTVTRPYVSNTSFRSAPLHACMFVSLSGKLVATRRYAYYAADGGWDPNWYLWYGLKMQNPTVKMYTGTISGAGCDYTRPLAFSHATLLQQWYEASCHLGAQIGAGVPWSIQVTPTYTCGNHRVASRRTGYDRATSYAQYNSGYPASFSGQTLARKGDAFAVRGNVTVTGYRTISGTATSDTFSSRRVIAYMR